MKQFKLLFFINKTTSAQKAFGFIDYVGHKNDTIIKFRYADGYEIATVVEMRVKNKLIIFDSEEAGKFEFYKNNNQNIKDYFNKIIINEGVNFDFIEIYPKKIFAVHKKGENHEHICKIELKLVTK